jgi:NAD-dependent dihydropyrimidine dehydrogenase PreA subunit
MEKVTLNITDVLRSYAWIAFLVALAVLFLQAPHPSLADAEEKKALEIRGSMSLETISREWGTPTAYLIEGLKLPKDVPLNLALKELKDRYGFTMEDVRKLVADYQASGKPAQAVPASPASKKGAVHEGEKKKEGVGLALAIHGILCLAVLLLLRGKKLSNRLGIWILAPSLLIFGLLFRANAEPMRAIVQVFQSLALGRYSLQATLLVFLAFTLMTFIGVKLVCGWGCPVGTLQELLYRLPIFNEVKKKRTPFWFSNSVRVAIFAFFLILVFGLIFGLKDQSLFRYFNPFRLFEWNFRVTAPIFVILIFGLSLFNYRPYCMFVCPFGLFSWLIQDLSIFRVRVNKDTCLDCGKCGRACPTKAAEGILQGKTFKADCFSCARCLNACPNDSLGYRALV